MKYRIISLDHKENSAIIRFYTDTINEDFLASSFDINNNIVRTDVGYPERCRTDVNITFYNHESTPEELDELIKSHAPVTWFELQEKIIFANNTLNIHHLEVGKEVEFESIIPEIPEINEALTDEEIDKLLEQLTTKN